MRRRRIRLQIPRPPRPPWWEYVITWVVAVALAVAIMLGLGQLEVFSR
jgi:Na+-translocating ferredoxin:NAD+ oxidoreductase RnfD subunit